MKMRMLTTWALIGAVTALTEGFVPLVWASETTASLTGEATVTLSGTEIDCVATLLHLGQDHLVLDGRQGIYTPAPGLRRLGVKSISFDVPLDGIAQLVNVKLHDLNSLGAQIQLEGDQITLRLPFEDEGKELTTAVGSVDMTNIAVVAVLKAVTRAGGTQVLYPVSSRFEADLKGSGLLSSKLVLDQVRKIVGSTLEKEVKMIFEIGGLQDGLVEGLKTWGEFATGREWNELAPGTLRIEGGMITYSVRD
jgi:hypothetical protein